MSKQNKMKTIKILILEDDLKTLSVVFDKLSQIEYDFLPIVLSTHEQVEDLINNSKLNFDIILLDRDCGLGGSFHILNIEKFGAEKVIGISTIPEYNNQLVERGVSMIVHKNHDDLEQFGNDLVLKIQRIIN